MVPSGSCEVPGAPPPVASGDDAAGCIGSGGALQGRAVSTDVFAISREGHAEIWRPETGESIRSFSGHMPAARAAALSTDGDFVLAVCEDSSSKLWSLETGTCMKCFGKADEAEAMYSAAIGHGGFVEMKFANEKGSDPHIGDKAESGGGGTLIGRDRAGSVADTAMERSPTFSGFLQVGDGDGVDVLTTSGALNGNVSVGNEAQIVVLAQDAVASPVAIDSPFIAKSSLDHAFAATAVLPYAEAHACGCCSGSHGTDVVSSNLTASIGPFLDDTAIRNLSCDLDARGTLEGPRDTLLASEGSIARLCRESPGEHVQRVSGSANDMRSASLVADGSGLVASSQYVQRSASLGALTQSRIRISPAAPSDSISSFCPSCPPTPARLQRSVSSHATCDQSPVTPLRLGLGISRLQSPSVLHRPARPPSSSSIRKARLVSTCSGIPRSLAVSCPSLVRPLLPQHHVTSACSVPAISAGTPSLLAPQVPCAGTGEKTSPNVTPSVRIFPSALAQASHNRATDLRCSGQIIPKHRVPPARVRSSSPTDALSRSVPNTLRARSLDSLRIRAPCPDPRFGEARIDFQLLPARDSAGCGEVKSSMPCARRASQLSSVLSKAPSDSAAEQDRKLQRMRCASPHPLGAGDAGTSLGVSLEKFDGGQRTSSVLAAAWAESGL